jgi:hypothetical protein
MYRLFIKIGTPPDRYCFSKNVHFFKLNFGPHPGLRINADPDPDLAFHFNAYPDPAFTFMRIRIQLRFKVKGICDNWSVAYPDPDLTFKNNAAPQP